MRLAALLLCLAPVAGSAESVFTAEEAAVLQQGLIVTADEFILPSYQAQASAGTALTQALTSHCSGEVEAVTVKARFADLFLAWQRSSLVQIGPIMEAEGPMRVQLWPDPKGFSRRAILSALNDADPAMLEPGALDGRSIALVNLTALEDLIEDHMAPGTYACDLATAIARFQTGLAEELVADWQSGAPFRTSYDTAVEGNDAYGSVDDLIRELLAGMIVGIDRVRKFKIARGLGPQPGVTYPERTEAVASGLGLPSIAASFDALRDLYELPYGFFDVTPEVGGAMEYFMLGETAGSVADVLFAETASLAEIVAEDGQRAADLRRYGELLLFQEDYLKTGLPGTIGLTSGFTSADGD